MQAAASIPVAALPQAGPQVDGPPKQSAPGSRDKVPFTALLQRGLEQAEAPEGAPAPEEDAALTLEPEPDRAEEEAAEQAAGLAASLLGPMAVNTGEVPASGGPVSEGLEGLDGISERPAPVPRPAPEAAVPEAAQALPDSFHVKLVQEKIARILKEEAAPAIQGAAQPANEANVPGDVGRKAAPEAAPEALQAIEDRAPEAEGTNPAEPAAGRDLTADRPSPAVSQEKVQGLEAEGVTRAAETAEEAPIEKDGTRTRAAERAAERVPTHPARFEAAAPEAAARAEAAERALMRFADDFREMRTGVREIRITLEPESLGELTISVRKTEDGIAARIFSPDRQVCSAVAEKLPLLQSAIEQSGLSMRELEIVYTPAGFQDSQAQSDPSGRQGRGRSPDRRAVEALTGDEKGAFWSGFELGGLPEDATVVYRI